MAKRRSLIASGCGCFLAAPAGLMTFGAFLAAVQGTAPIGDMAISMTCFGVMTLLGLAAFVFGLSKRSLTPEEAMQEAAKQAMAGGTAPGHAAPVGLAPGTSAAQARDAFRGAMGVDPTEASRRWDAATDLMMSRRFPEAMQAFEAIKSDIPDRAGDAQVSIGACLHMLGRYQDAIAAYESARALGADSMTVDENIAESREALAKG